MKKQVLRFAIPLFLLLVATGLTPHHNADSMSRKDRKGAEQVANQLHALLLAKDYEATLKLFSTACIEKMGKEEIIRLFRMLPEKLGDLQSTAIASWGKRSIEGSDQQAYALIYTVTYAKFEAKETITFVREEDRQFRILMYSVQSDGLINN